ncbi:transposable element Tcb2 transposase [Trichonephila clavipes]|nr:transposable element Tcb2 transposase [Trichonephila clavipes]
MSTIQCTTASSIPPVVPSTISQFLAEVVLCSQRPLRCLPLTLQHRRDCLQWCCSRSSWLPSDWHHIVFSDESHLTVEADVSSCLERPGPTVSISFSFTKTCSHNP